MLCEPSGDDVHYTMCERVLIWGRSSRRIPVLSSVPWVCVQMCVVAMCVLSKTIHRMAAADVPLYKTFSQGYPRPPHRSRPP